MFLEKSTKKLKEIIAYLLSSKETILCLLPSFVILGQWFDIFGVKISWIISLCLGCIIVQRLGELLKNDILIVILGIIIGLPLISLLFGGFSNFNFSLYISLGTGVVYLVFICLLNETEFHSLMRGVFFSCALFTIWGCLEIFTGNYLLFNNPAFTERLNWRGSHYPGVAFANTNDLAQYLVMVFPISAVFYLRKSKLLYWIFAILVFFVIFHTDSRLSMIVFVLTLGADFGIRFIFPEDEKEKRLNKFIGIFALLFLLMLEVGTGSISSFIKKFMKISVSADYFEERADLYKTLLLTAVKLPFGAFGVSYTVQEMPPHNLFLYVLCDFGWIPAILLIALLIELALCFAKNIKNKNDTATFIALLLGICFFPITSSISSCNEQRKVVWLILAIFLRFWFSYKSETENPFEKKLLNKCETER